MSGVWVGVPPLYFLMLSYDFLIFKNEHIGKHELTSPNKIGEKRYSSFENPFERA